MRRAVSITSLADLLARPTRVLAAESAPLPPEAAQNGRSPGVPGTDSACWRVFKGRIGRDKGHRIAP
jgi:hypothetical protein